MPERAGCPRGAWVASEAGLQAFCVAKRPEVNPEEIALCDESGIQYIIQRYSIRFPSYSILGMGTNEVDSKDFSLLSELHLFSSLDKDTEFPFIWNICKYSIYEPASVLLKQGELSKSLFIVLHGDVKVLINGVTIDSIQIRRGGMLGEVEFFNALPCSATAITTIRSEIVSIDYDLLEKVIEANPKIGLKIYRAFTMESLGKLKAVTDQMLYLSAGSSSLQIAHDIRSPLAALRVLSTRLNSVSSDDRELLSIIVDRIDRIASAVLGKSSIVGNGSTDPSEVFSLNGLKEILERIVTEKELHSKRVISLEVNDIPLCNESNQLQVRANPNELERIISNLIDNSIQATSCNGSICVSLTYEQTRVYVRVADNGRGIPADVLSKLGKNRITFGKENGNGIGLFQAFQRVQAWGGTVKVGSDMQIGTTILISLLVFSANN